MPLCLRHRRDGRDSIKLRKNAINLPCLRRTGFVGETSNEPTNGAGNTRFLGTLSPIVATQLCGKNPTSYWLFCKWLFFPRHHADSAGLGMSITDIISPTSIEISSHACALYLLRIKTTFKINKKPFRMNECQWKWQ